MSRPQCAGPSALAQASLISAGVRRVASAISGMQQSRREQRAQCQHGDDTGGRDDQEIRPVVGELGLAA